MSTDILSKTVVNNIQSLTIFTKSSISDFWESPWNNPKNEIKCINCKYNSSNLFNIFLAYQSQFDLFYLLFHDVLRIFSSRQIVLLRTPFEMGNKIKKIME